MKNIRSATHEYFKQFDARNFLHGSILVEPQEKKYVKYFLADYENAECVQDSGINFLKSIWSHQYVKSEVDHQMLFTV